MRVLALVTSNRKKGNTDRIVQMIEAQAHVLAARQGVPLEFETLHLGDLDIRPCRGCRACFDRGEDHCPLKDDVPLIREKMGAADGLIIASPVYVYDVNGVAKNWIDRLAYLCHRPALAGKCAYLVATVGGGPTGYALQTLNIALRTWGYHIVGQAGYKMGALLPQNELEMRFPNATNGVAEAISRAIAQQEFLRPGLLSLMMFRIQQLAWQREPPGSVDQTHWQGRGWLDSGCTFYIPHRANPVVVALARLVGAAVHRLVT